MVESLSSQLEEHKKLHALEVMNLRSEFAEREDSYEVRINEDGRMLENVTCRCTEIESKWREGTKNLNEVIYKLSVLERESQEKYMNYETNMKDLSEEVSERAKRVFFYGAKRGAKRRSVEVSTLSETRSEATSC